MALMRGSISMFFHDWVRHNYGCQKGFVRSIYHNLMDYLGRYAPLDKINWGRVERLVFLCQGNICRSAYAEARARSLRLPATSFGLGARSGGTSPPLIQSLATEGGIDLCKHRSRTLAEIDLSESDLILGMEPIHLHLLTLATPKGSYQATLLGLWCRRRRPHIEDPYGLNQEYVRTCLSLIDEAVTTVAAQFAK